MSDTCSNAGQIASRRTWATIGIALLSTLAHAAPPGALELVLSSPEPPAEPHPLLRAWWIIVLALATCTAGALLVLWGLKGVTPWGIWKSSARTISGPGPLHTQGLSPKDVQRVAKVLGLPASEQQRLTAAAGRMGLASPVGLFLVPEAAASEPATRDAVSPRVGTTRRSR
jgi:hypothetical protein